MGYIRKISWFFQTFYSIYSRMVVGLELIFVRIILTICIHSRSFLGSLYHAILLGPYKLPFVFGISHEDVSALL